MHQKFVSDCNWTRTRNQLVRKQTLNHLAKLAKWFSVHLQIKWLWVRVQLQSDFVPVSSKEFLDIQATIECGFTMKHVLDIIRIYSQKFIV